MNASSTRPQGVASNASSLLEQKQSIINSSIMNIFLTARLAALEVADRALLNECYHPPIGVGRMI